MGFFNKVFSFMGFEDNEEPRKPEKKNARKSTNKVKSSYQLNPKSKKNKQLKTKKLDNQQEIAEAIEIIKAEGGLIVDLSSFEKGQKVRAFDFISGAVFALDGQMEKLKPNVYICSLDELDYFLEEKQ